MPLFLDAGYATRAARHGFNVDACQMVVPEPRQMDAHGALFVVTDGLRDQATPEQASATAALELSNCFFAAHEGWTSKHALVESLHAANHALRSTGERGRSAAVSALAVRGRRWTLTHLGHTRAWLFRDGRLKLLTHDHVTPRPSGPPQVDRALGLTDALNPDTSSGELSEGDVFILSTDGLHNALDGAMMIGCLSEDSSAKQMANQLVQRARNADGNDDCTACVIRIEQLPLETNLDLEEAVATLPLVTPPEPGETIDGFRIEQMVHKSRRFRIYQATDTESNETVALKFPDASLGSTPEVANSFLHEEWIGRRINSSYLVRSLPLRAGRRSALYSTMAWHEGENLARRARRKGGLPLREALFLMRELLSALDDLHNRGIVHRDVRPKNLLLDKPHKQLLLIGLGSSHIANLWEAAENPALQFADLNFLAPEVIQGNEATVASDIYAAGATFYYLLTGQLPYGQIRRDSEARFDNYTPLHQHQADIPVWVDDIVRQACAKRPAERFLSAEEFANTLDEARTYNRQEVQRPATMAISSSGEASRWGWAAISVVAFGLLVYLAFILT